MGPEPIYCEKLHAGPTRTAGRARRRACERGAIMEAASDFAQLELRLVDQIQWRYELIRPLILFANRPATHRAHETHTHPETVRQLRRRFQQQGMLGLLLDDVEVVPKEHTPRVSVAVVQEI